MPERHDPNLTYFYGKYSKAKFKCVKELLPSPHTRGQKYKDVALSFDRGLIPLSIIFKSQI